MSDVLRFDILVVGAGPAGLAAALAASESGAKVGLVDENLLPGGQIYRASGGKLNPAVSGQVEALTAAGVQICGGLSVFDALEPGSLRALGKRGVVRLDYQKLILAVGARELFLPFPGWTLPNVMGVGGLQALVKSGLDVEGKRIVVAGSGPLLIAVGAYLKDHGAKVVCIAEQAGTANLAKFLTSLLKVPSKISQGVGLMSQVGSLIKRGTWVERADGKHKLESVKLNNSHASIPCDYLACAFGFVPNVELPLLLGCALADGFVKVDDLQLTTVDSVYCAGEPTGIGGIDLSIVEGKIAGYSSSHQPEKAGALVRERTKWQAFATALDRTFAPRPELKALATPETVVCRCEDVKLEQLAGWESSRSAKLHTRCGMGPCQGRICGPATRFLYGWDQGTVRSPLIPTPMSALDAETERGRGL